MPFPIPPFKNEFPDDDVPQQSFQGFRLWIDGKPIQYEVEAKATLNGKDVTELLEANHIDIATLGHFVDTVDATYAGVAFTQDFDRLPKPARENLVSAGLFVGTEDPILPTWTVHLQYHWTQTFPARATIHIRHEYAPATGGQVMLPDPFKRALAAGVKRNAKPLRPGRPQDDDDLLASFCPDLSVLRAMVQSFAKADSQDGGYPSAQWVDFILTTANTWKQPIEDFTFVVERPKPDQDGKTLISFCSPQDGKVEKVDPDHFQVHLSNFVPNAELHIGFFDMPMPRVGSIQKSKAK